MQKNYKKDQSVFKLCVYYSHKSNGVAYNINEISHKEHRKYHDSFDFIPVQDGWLTRHDIAFNKLLNHLKKHRDKIFSALLFVNNFKAKKQYLIGSYNKSTDFDIQIQPNFYKHPDGSVTVQGLNQPPLKTFDL